jgi:hypothetical protein
MLGSALCFEKYCWSNNQMAPLEKEIGKQLSVGAPLHYLICRNEYPKLINLANLTLIILFSKS